MKTMFAAALISVLTVPAAAEVPDKTFFSGNDVYQWCQHDKATAQAYVGGLFDMAAHGASVIDSMRNHNKGLLNNDVEISVALDRVAGFCKPEHATLEQMTDVFCTSLRNSPAERHGLPALLFNDSLKKAWRCPGK
jgi:Rap1a immunity proteins